MHRKSVGKTLEIATVRQEQTREAVDLGMWLGRRQAFALVAGRCSAADAECIRDMRKNKRYRALQVTWEQFCAQRLGIGRATADQIVRHLEEFGPEFFTLAQLTKVTAAEYRRLRVAVRRHALLHAGEEIPIEAENGPRLAAAIEELRRNAKSELADASEEQGPGRANLQIGRLPINEVEIGRLPINEVEIGRLPIAELEVDRLPIADLEIGGPGHGGQAKAAGSPCADLEFGGPRRGICADAGDAMTDAEREFASVKEKLRTNLVELEHLRATRLELGDRLRLHSLVGYAAHKFNRLRLAVRL